MRNTDQLIGVVAGSMEDVCKANAHELYAAVAANLGFVDEALAQSKAGR